MVLTSAPLDGPAAMVNLTGTEVITKKQLQQRFDETEQVRIQTGLAIPPQPEDKVLDTMIAEILIRQAAVRDGISATDGEIENALENQRKNAEVQLKRQGQLNNTDVLTKDRFKALMEDQTRMSWEEIKSSMRKQIIQQKFIMQNQAGLLGSIAGPTESEIQERYQKIATKLVNPEIVRFSQIYISTVNRGEDAYAELQDKAEEALTKLKRGETFSAVVTEYTDDAKSRYSGGEFGYIARDDSRAEAYFGKTFFTKLFELNTGSISSVLRSNIGFHIIKVVEHRDAKILTLDDQLSPTNNITVREYISRLLLSEKQQQTLQRAYTQAVAELKEQAEIRIFE